MNQSGVEPAKVCAVILAGGRGLRMGGVDKGLQTFQGLPMARHALQRLQAQQGGAPAVIGFNANRNPEAYAQWGPVWPDLDPDYAGPLAGFAAALQHCPQDCEWLLTVPCDSPRFPLDLLSRLGAGLHAAAADLAVATAPEWQPDGSSVLRSQPVFCLLHTRLRDSLLAFVQGGGRKIDAWTAQHACVRVPFGAPGDALAFSNVNTRDQLAAMETP